MIKPIILGFFLIIFNVWALEYESHIEGIGTISSSMSNDNFKETVDASGDQTYARSIVSSKDQSEFKSNYIYINKESDSDQNNYSYHFISAESPLGVKHFMGVSTSETSTSKASITNTANSVSTKYNVTTEWGNISEGLTDFTNGQNYMSSSELRGKYKLLSKLTEEVEGDLEDGARLIYEVNSVNLIGESGKEEVRAKNRPTRIVGGVPLPPRKAAEIYYIEAINLVSRTSGAESDGDKELLNWAIENLTISLDYDPEYYSAWGLKAEIHDKLNETNAALMAIDKALEIDENSEAWQFKGSILFESKEYANAAKSYEKALEMDPSDDLTWFNLGNAFYKLNNYDRAAESFKKATDLNPGDPGYWCGLGNAYFALGRYSEAKASLIKALDLGLNELDADKGKNAQDKISQIDNLLNQSTQSAMANS